MAITWANIDLISKVFCDIYLKLICSRGQGVNRTPQSAMGPLLELSLGNICITLALILSFVFLDIQQYMFAGQCGANTNHVSGTDSNKIKWCTLNSYTIIAL